MRRPSRFSGFAVNLLSSGLSLITFVVATFIAIFGFVFLFSNKSHPKRQDTQTQTSSNDNDLRSSEEKLKSGAGSLIDITTDAAQKAGKVMTARPNIAVPNTAFAYLVEHLLGRGAQCPSPYDSFDACLSQCSSADLNRPIGLRYWEEQDGVWTLKSVSEFSRLDVRDDAGPTYKALYFSDTNPPANALPRDATVLTLAAPERVMVLTKAGADPELRYGEDGNTALIEAAQRGDVPKVKALVAAGASKTTRAAGNGQEPINLVDESNSSADEIKQLLSR